MSIVKLQFDSMLNKISWDFDGENIEVLCGSTFSSVRNDLQRNRVCGVVRENGNISRLTYYSYSGEKEFDTIIPEGEININYKQSKTKIKYDNLKIVEYYPNNNIVLIGLGNETFSEKIIGISVKGEVLFEKSPPQQSKFWYFGIFNGTPNVACIGVEDAEGVHGRSGYWYEVQASTGDLTKRDIVY